MALDLHMAQPKEALSAGEGRFVDLVDGLLRHGVVIKGEIWLTVADVDLVFLGAHLVLSSPDKMQCERQRIGT